MKALLFTLIFAGTLRAEVEDKWMELNSEGIRLTRAGKFAAAEVKFRAALLEVEAFPENDFRRTANLSNLALAMQEQGALAEAEKIYRKVLELREQFLGMESIEVASTLNNLATVLHSAMRDREADPLIRRALLIAENAHDDQVIAPLLNTLGLALIGQGESARAEPVLRRAMAVFEKAGMGETLDAGKTANNLAALYLRNGEIEKAEAMQRAAVPLYRKNVPDGHPLMAAVLNNLFTILAMEKKFEEGEPYLMSALEIAGKADPRSLQTQHIRENYAILLAARGKWEEATRTLESVVAEKERLLGPNDPGVAASLVDYSEALKHVNHKSEAKQAQKRAAEIMKSFRP